MARRPPLCVGTLALSRTARGQHGFNDAKALVYRPTQADRQAWEALGGTTVERARGFGGPPRTQGSPHLGGHDVRPGPSDRWQRVSAP